MPTPEVFRAEARARRLAALLAELWDACGTAFSCDLCPRHGDECYHGECYFADKLRKLGVVE